MGCRPNRGSRSFLCRSRPRRAPVGDDVYTPRWRPRSSPSCSTRSSCATPGLARRPVALAGRADRRPPSPAKAAASSVCDSAAVAARSARPSRRSRCLTRSSRRDPAASDAQLRARGVPCVFGDAAHRALLAGRAWRGRRSSSWPAGDRARTPGGGRRARAATRRAAARARPRSRRGGGATRQGRHRDHQPELEASATLIRHALAGPRAAQGPHDRLPRAYRSAMERADAGGAAAGALPEVRELALGAAGVTDRSLRDARIRERFGVTVVAIRRADGLVLNRRPTRCCARRRRARVRAEPTRSGVRRRGRDGRHGGQQNMGGPEMAPTPPALGAPRKPGALLDVASPTPWARRSR